MMTDDEKFEYWLDFAQNDLETAEALLKAGRWLYVIVMCQQAIEKLVKGLYLLYINDNVPRIHNIRDLVNRFEDKLPVSVPPDKYALFDALTKFYVNDRYPEYISKVSTLTKEPEASATMTKTREAFAWLLTLKP